MNLFELTILFDEKVAKLLSISRNWVGKHILDVVVKSRFVSILLRMNLIIGAKLVCRYAKFPQRCYFFPYSCSITIS